MRINFNIERWHLGIVVFLLMGFIGFGIGEAYGTNNPPAFGHSWYEVEQIAPLDDLDSIVVKGNKPTAAPNVWCNARVDASNVMVLDCNNPAPGGGGGTVTSVGGGTGLSGTVTTSGNINLDTGGISSCMNPTSSKIYWDGTRLACGTDQTGGGSFDIHDDVTSSATIADADRIVFSDEGTSLDPMRYTTFANLKNEIGGGSNCGTSGTCTDLFGGTIQNPLTSIFQVSDSLTVSGDLRVNGGNVGIGTAPSSSYALLAAGEIRATGDIESTGANLKGNRLRIGDSTGVNLGIGDIHATNRIISAGDLTFYGDILPDGFACNDGQILKRAGVDNWDCVEVSDQSYTVHAVRETSSSTREVNVGSYRYCYVSSHLAEGTPSLCRAKRSGETDTLVADNTHSSWSFNARTTWYLRVHRGECRITCVD